ncbi:hypothetical protein [Aquimarina muelleri]|nr:hypothetical protein [Aquimarina muelleri]MCX2762166.1 hypothetical protein [Aquimarina muelleri]
MITSKKIISQNIGNPIFLISLGVLILNDWFLKAFFHNTITGKLSDFAGLIAFPFFLSLFFIEQKKTIHILIGILFVFWKSTWSQPLINICNQIGLPLYRTVDYTDLIALPSIFISYSLLKNKRHLKLRPFLSKTVIICSSIAFIATSMPPRENRKYVDINKEYVFNFSKTELVSRLNMIQLYEIQKLNKRHGKINFNSETNIFHYQNNQDTLSLILDNKMVSHQDTIKFKTSFVDIEIVGNKDTSALKLLNLYQIVTLRSKKNYRKIALKQFEKRIINGIRKYR